MSSGGQWIRAAIVRIVDRGDSTTVLGATATRRFDGDSGALVRAVLEICTRAVTRDELLAALAERAGGAVPSGPVDELIEMLEDDGVLVDAAHAVSERMVRQLLARRRGGRRVVLGISGAVAAVDAPALVRGLHRIGCEVRIALTRSAPRFVGIAALEALTHHQVWRSLWQRDERAPVPHVNLAEWAELVLVCPATATTIARIAAGDCSDLVSAIATATRAPVAIAPSMNDAMYDAPAVQANLAALREQGRWIIHPAHGLEVAHPPGERTTLIGPAPPAGIVVEIVLHLLGQLGPRPTLDAAAWERLWATTPSAHLPWHADAVEPELAEALARLAPSRLIDLGTGDGTVAIEAARRGCRVTATDVSASALGRARDRAGELPILFVLDDVTAPRLEGAFDVAVDRGLLHCLPRDRWPAYADSVTALVASGGALLIVAHGPGMVAPELATSTIDETELRALLPAFELVRSAPTELSRAAALLFELRRV